ncbi:phage tail assembly protein [Nitratidesulfovibrio liaohensis]|uniref:phage tail assembly protein n=1 Tax=Nitratidesulfovibrio liaohensis TaxID=2604158 RepID=UPI0014229F57|nr:phage tail assembly protein [Nitratidesulfovibrio liaohensis]NHZ48586.1 phage tail assembly protein [Nitratidesulfovibrio liaohensis]
MTATSQPREPKVIRLSRPLFVGEATYEQLSMREPYVKDQLAVDEPGQTQGEVEMRLIGRLCDLNTEALRELPVCDYVQLQRALMGFISPQAAASAAPRSNSDTSPDGAGTK